MMMNAQIGLPGVVQSFLMTGARNVGVTAAATVYGSPSATNGAGVTSPTEANMQEIVMIDSQFHDLTIITGTAQPVDGALSITLRKNGIDTGVSITIPAGAAAGKFSDSTNAANFSAGDLISYKFVNSSASSSAGVGAISIMYAHG